ncbi:MAG: hypothetical protein AWU58_211 [Methanohalophilus sp. T328-1]|jgi:hypothetical protein|uniref:Uncharacterized protein n=1 Tax=Methanohalophilus euhalobius TaxID=51203 RepID=A0A285F5R9_9EURY|nr:MULTISPECIES: hypothetical protein [Methanohalophilus]KXS46845.1 MAG: hypothetical protein AWU58_211 [Methanohalophilus sp. T328-1]RSD36094.1 MAG: hypothetical protein CI952_481 [Methanohalophilus sp.]ODV50024.1 MAG: hypothetical protein A8273_683 [Methanohalophilus sp. 2-GBenrich]RXG34792.1 hypothetical protein CI957_386 [Methanohalophilus sp. WG1-DM]TCL12284.1 hypothetical protein C7960_1521 [Methanohalophilus euhalobius]
MDFIFRIGKSAGFFFCKMKILILLAILILVLLYIIRIAWLPELGGI